MKHLTVILVIIHFANPSLYGQNAKQDSTEYYNQLENRYQYLKDSLNNLQFVPAVSSVVLKNKQAEIIFYSSMLTANKWRDNNGKITEMNLRSTYWYNTLQFTYGISNNGKLNIGFDVNSVSARLDDDRHSSMFKVFGTDESGNSKYAKAITSFGPRVRWNPFQNTNLFTVQSSLLFPAGVSEEKQNITGKGQIFWLAQFLYNKPLSERLFLFSQLGIQYGFNKEDVSSKFYPTLSGYLSYFVPRRVIFFVLLSYTPVFMNDPNWYYSASTLQAGGGVQYQISKNILVNAYYSNNIAGKNYPDLNGYTLSLRFVTK